MSSANGADSFDTETVAAAAELLVRAGREPQTSFIPLAGGNNRVFQVGGTPPLLLKAYFHHPLDHRDRLGTEFAFLRYAWAAGLRTVPEPIAADPAHHLGLYGFLNGRRLEPGEVDACAVEQALALVEGLNDPAHRPKAAVLPPASEACFSLAAHLDTVERRIGRLAAIDASTPHHAEALTFLAQDLRPLWTTVREGVLAGAAALGVSLEAPLDEADRCLSPSDFGFHNALIEKGRASFLDFEYAGWDDPAKLIGDFFSQVAVPVPETFWSDFAGRLAALTGNPEYHHRRFDLLLPVYRVKWLTIILNDFLPAGAHRRRFALNGDDENARFAIQMTKARRWSQHLAEGLRKPYNHAGPGPSWSWWEFKEAAPP